MLQRSGTFIAALVVVAMGSWQAAEAGRCGHCRTAGTYGPCQTEACAPACAPCEPQMVEKTVMVPQMVTETRTVNVTKYREETRERTYTVHRKVMETNAVEREYTVMVPEQRTKTVTYAVRKPVYETKTAEYTVRVPHQEVRQGVRSVCHMVPTQETRTVCQRGGHWEERAFEVASGGCNPCGTAYRGCGPCAPQSACGTGCGTSACDTRTIVRRVWVPEVKTREVEVTVMRPQHEEQPYEYTVCVYRPEVRTRTFQTCSYVTEERTKEVAYTVCVPETRTKTVNVTTCRVVPEEKTETYTVRVPYTEQQEVQVQVCRMVPQTVTVACNSGCDTAAACGTCDTSCGTKCRPRHVRRGLLARHHCRTGC